MPTDAFGECLYWLLIELLAFVMISSAFQIEDGSKNSFFLWGRLAKKAESE
jgi:hypothetical protein